MTLAQGPAAIIVFWAIVGGIGASLLLPAMQSLIHGNFEGPRREGLRPGRARAAIAAAVGPLLGGFITTTCRGASRSCSRSWSSRSCSRASGSSATCRTRGRGDRPVGAILSVLGMGGVVLGILVWQEGGESVGALLADRRGRGSRCSSPGSCGASAKGKPTLLDPDLFRSKLLPARGLAQMLQQIALGGMMIALPIYLQMVLEYNAMEAGLSLAPLSLSMFAIALLAGGRRATGARAASSGSASRSSRSGSLVLIPIVPRADSGWALIAPLVIAGSGLGLLVSQLNNYTLRRSRRSASARPPA